MKYPVEKIHSSFYTRSLIFFKGRWNKSLTRAVSHLLQRNISLETPSYTCNLRVIYHPSCHQNLFVYSTSCHPYYSISRRTLRILSLAANFFKKIENSRRKQKASNFQENKFTEQFPNISCHKGLPQEFLTTC